MFLTIYRGERTLFLTSRGPPARVAAVILTNLGGFDPRICFLLWLSYTDVVTVVLDTRVYN